MANDAAAPAGEPVGGQERGENGSLGDILRGERLRRNLTLDELSRAARVPVRYLEALEGDEPESLPPRIYVRGYLDALARKLSLPTEEVHRRYDESLGGQSRQRREEGAVFALFRPQGERLHWRDWLVPLFLAAGAAVFLLGERVLEGSRDRQEPPLSPPPVQAEVLGGDLPSEARPPVELPPPGRELPSTAGVSVVVRGESTTWVSAQRDGGEEEEFAVRAGETVELEAREKVLLSLGNAGAVRLVYNGREIGFIGRKGEVKRNLVFEDVRNPHPGGDR